jgi:hypothetical protein
VFDNYAVTVMIGEEPYTLGLFDTAGELLVDTSSRPLVAMGHTCSPFSILPRPFIVVTS